MKWLALFLAVTAQGATLRKTDADSSNYLLAWFPMQELAASPLGSVGTMTNGTPSTVPSVFGNGLQFSATNEYINVSSLSATGSVSFECWASPTQIASPAYLVTKSIGSSTWGFQVVQANSAISTGAGWIFRAVDQGSGTGSTFGGTATAGVWHYIVAVFDGPNKTGKLYVNGIQVGTTSTVFAQSTLRGGGTFALPGTAVSPGAVSPINLSQAFIWGRPLSASEISDKYNSRKAFYQ